MVRPVRGEVDNVSGNHTQGRVPAALSQQLSEHFADPELVGLTFLIGFINMLNLFKDCLEVRYNGEYSVFKEPVA